MNGESSSKADALSASEAEWRDGSDGLDALVVVSPNRHERTTFIGVGNT